MRRLPAKLLNHLRDGAQILQVPVLDGDPLLGPWPVRARCCGLDPVPANLQRARELASSRAVDAAFAAGFPWDIPFADRSFDLVICPQALSNCPSVEGLVAELSRVVKDDGLVVLLESTSLTTGEHHVVVATPLPRGFVLLEVDS